MGHTEGTLMWLELQTAGKEGAGLSRKGRWGHTMGAACSPNVCLCLCFGDSQNIPVPSSSTTHQPCSNLSQLSPPACLAHNKLKNTKRLAISVFVLSPATLSVHLFLLLSSKVPLAGWWEGWLQEKIFSHCFGVGESEAQRVHFYTSNLEHHLLLEALLDLPTHPVSLLSVLIEPSSLQRMVSLCRYLPIVVI